MWFRPGQGIYSYRYQPATLLIFGAQAEELLRPSFNCRVKTEMQLMARQVLRPIELVSNYPVVHSSQ
jgi:hypothetical protein